MKYLIAVLALVLLILLLVNGGLSLDLGQNQGTITNMITASRQSEAELVTAGQMPGLVLAILAIFVAVVSAIAFLLAFSMVGGFKGLASFVRQRRQVDRLFREPARRAGERAIQVTREERERAELEWL
jgi:hypothetical protein